MLNRIIEWSLSNRLLVCLALVLSIGGGIWALSEIRVEGPRAQSTDRLS